MPVQSQALVAQPYIHQTTSQAQNLPQPQPQESSTQPVTKIQRPGCTKILQDLCSSFKYAILFAVLLGLVAISQTVDLQNTDHSLIGRMLKPLVDAVVKVFSDVFTNPYFMQFFEKIYQRINSNFR